MNSSSNNGSVMDWQSGIGTMQEGIGHLWETGEHSDVEFLVGKQLWDEKLQKWISTEEPKLFKAHKLLLTIRSSVFATQFGFNNSIQDNEPIKIIDVTASAFGAMLKFLYTNDTSLIDSDNFLEVYSAARKYWIQTLVQQCHGLAPTMLNWKNSVEVWKTAKLHDDKVLISHCLQFFDINIQKVEGDNVALWSLNREEFGELLTRDTLQVYSESDHFYFLYRWAKKQCKNAGIDEPNGQELRDKIGHLIYAIPFSLIPHDFFIKQIIPTGILTVEEISAMLVHYCGDADPLPFTAQPRANRYQGLGHNKLVDKNVVEMEKADLLEEIDHLKKEKAKSENEKAKSEETIQQLKMEKAISEEKIKQLELEKNMPKLNPVCEAVEKKKGMWRTFIQKK